MTNMYRIGPYLVNGAIVCDLQISAKQKVSYDVIIDTTIMTLQLCCSNYAVVLYSSKVSLWTNQPLAKFA